MMYEGLFWSVLSNLFRIFLQETLWTLKFPFLGHSVATTPASERNRANGNT